MTDADRSKAIEQAASVEDPQGQSHVIGKAGRPAPCAQRIRTRRRSLLRRLISWLMWSKP